MKVFVTGATGYIGLELVRELIAHGHAVTGLARSDASANKLESVGASSIRGDIENIASLQEGARAADGVMHLAMIHDFHNLAKSFAIDRAAITAMAEALKGTGKPLVVTSDTMVLTYGKVGTERDCDFEPGTTLSGRAESEPLLKSLTAEMGIRGVIVRLAPVVHGEGDRAYTGMLVDLARKNQAAIYVGDGSQRWAAVHKKDAVACFRLALEKGPAGAVYHAVAEDGVSLKALSEVVAKKLSIPAQSQSRQEAEESLGFMAEYVDADSPASGHITRRELGWEPQQLDWLADVEANYFTA